MSFKDFVDSDPVMKSIQRRASIDGLETNTNMHYGDLLNVIHAACRRAFETGAGRFRPLFDHNARLNEQGQALYREISDTVIPIGNGFIRDGFSPREVGHIVQMAALDIELEGVLNLEPAKE